MFIDLAENKYGVLKAIPILIRMVIIQIRKASVVDLMGVGVALK